MSSFGHDVLPERGTLDLVIRSVPAGEYSLSVVALDGREYEPAELTVRPPATVELVGRGDPDPPTRLRIVDSVTGLPLYAFEVACLRLGSLFTVAQSKEEDLGEVAIPPGTEAVFVLRRGYRPVLLRPERTSDTREVGLVPGWGELLRFLDVDGVTVESGWITPMPPVAGVEVRADGALLASSDGDGLAFVEGVEEPSRLEFTLPGWRFVQHRRLLALHEVWMARSP